MLIAFESVGLAVHCNQQENMNKSAEEENVEHIPWLNVKHVGASGMDEKIVVANPTDPRQGHISL